MPPESKTVSGQIVGGQTSLRFVIPIKARCRDESRGIFFLPVGLFRSRLRRAFTSSSGFLSLRVGRFRWLRELFPHDRRWSLRPRRRELY